MVWSYERPVATSRHVSVPCRRAPRRGGSCGEYRGLGLHRAQREDRPPRAAVRADHGDRAGTAPDAVHVVLALRRLGRVPVARGLGRAAGAPRVETSGLMLGDFKRDLTLLSGRVTELRGHL